MNINDARGLIVVIHVDGTEHRDLRHVTNDWFEPAADPEYFGAVGDPMTFLTRTIARFDEYFAGLTEDRRAHPTDDLATVEHLPVTCALR